MTPLQRADVSAGLAAEYTAFAELAAGITADEWSAPTRCRGWQVRHAAGHVLGQAADLDRGVIGSRSPDEQAQAFAALTVAEAARQLTSTAGRIRKLLGGMDDGSWAAPSPASGFSNGTAALWLWSDTYVHADDIRDALGRPPERGPGLAAAFCRYTSELRTRRWGPARLRLDGQPRCDFGTGGPLVNGDPLRFVLTAAGRRDPAELGLGPSVNVYRSEPGQQ